MNFILRKISWNNEKRVIRSQGRLLSGEFRTNPSDLLPTQWVDKHFWIYKFSNELRPRTSPFRLSRWLVVLGKLQLNIWRLNWHPLSSIAPPRSTAVRRDFHLNSYFISPFDISTFIKLWWISGLVDKPEPVATRACSQSINRSIPIPTPFQISEIARLRSEVLLNF